MDELVSFKVFLHWKNSDDVEVRRIAIPSTFSKNFTVLCQQVEQVFPSLKNKSYSVNWKDEDGDDITISSHHELELALTEMKTNVKKLYIKGRDRGQQEVDGSETVHRFVFCDGCQNEIRGFRYKCVICKDYDLCWVCEGNAMHSEHPMLRISNPLMFDRRAISKLVKILSYASHKLDLGDSKKRHSADSTSSDHCKKKMCGKQEYSLDSDNSDGGHCKQHGKRKLKTRKDLYKHLLGAYLQYLEPHCEAENSEQRAEPTHTTYLNSIGNTISSLLQPFGVDVDFEIQPPATKEDKPKSESKDDSEKKKSEQETPSTSACTQQKEVRFEIPNDKAEAFEKTVDKIMMMLEKQKVTESPDKDDWEEFEELKVDSSDIPSNESFGAISKTVSTTSEGTPGTPAPGSSNLPSAPPQTNNNNLYPDLNLNVANRRNIHEALQKLLEMGFSNEEGWLTQLVIAKNGNVDEILKVLTPA